MIHKISNKLKCDKCYGKKKTRKRQRSVVLGRQEAGCGIKWKVKGGFIEQMRGGQSWKEELFVQIFGERVVQAERELK